MRRRTGKHYLTGHPTMTDKPWLLNYPSGVPEFIAPLEFNSLSEFFERAISQYPDQPALTNYGVTLTYTELERHSRNFAYFLFSLGLQKGDRVAIMLPNMLQYPVALMAVLRAGLIVVNTNPLYTARELKHQLNDSGATTIIILENFAHVLASIQPETSIKHVVITNLGDMFPFVKAMLTRFIARRIKKMVPSYHLPDAVPFNRALVVGHPYAQRLLPQGLDDIAFLQYTGGTTGLSKGAMLTHKNILSNISQTTAWITHGNPSGKEIQTGREMIITALPLYHIFSLTANLLTFIGLGAENVLITNPRDMKAFVHELKRRKFTCITGVNTLYEALMNAPGFTSLDFSSLKIAIAGGMATRTTTASRWKRVTGNTLIEAYGLTETSPAVTINPLNSLEFSGSIGLPLPSTECEIRDETGDALPIGKAGELYVRGPQVMQGYWTQETTEQLSSSGWLRTGDVAYIDEGGFVYLKDRTKDMILVSGFNVYPSEIEMVVYSHPDILECAAIGVPDEKTGEAVKIFVVSRNPALEKASIIEHCRKHLTAYKIPKLIEFRASLPKSTIGKVLRRALK